MNSTHSELRTLSHCTNHKHEDTLALLGEHGFRCKDVSRIVELVVLRSKSTFSRRIGNDFGRLWIAAVLTSALGNIKATIVPQSNSYPQYRPNSLDLISSLPSTSPAFLFTPFLASSSATGFSETLGCLASSRHIFAMPSFLCFSSLSSASNSTT